MPELTLENALRLPDPLGMDFETTGLNWLTDIPLTLGLGNNQEHGYIDIQKYTKEQLRAFFLAFFKTHRPILQNAKFDFHFLAKFLTIDEIFTIEYADTMLASQIIDENASHGLDNMVTLWMPNASLEAKHAVDDYKKAHKLKTYVGIPIELISARGEEDALNTCELYSILRPRLTETKVYKLEKDLTKVLLRVEHNGAPLDKEYLLKVQSELQERVKVISDRHPGVELSSPQQVAEYLFKTLQLEAKVFTPKKHLPKTDDGALSVIDHPAAKDVLEFRNLSHTLSTYVTGFLEKMDDNNFIHCTFRQMGARTGRMSCVNPNLQQLPKEGVDGELVKTAFIGNVTTFDYSQMEAVLYAFMAKEEGMIETIRRHDDLYKYLARTLYNKQDISKAERGQCKGLFLGRIYGMGNAKFIAQSKGLDPEKTREFFGRLSALTSSVTNKILMHGFVETIIGRKRHLFEEDAYKGLNAIIQGSGADIVKTVMVGLPVELQNKLMVQVHDELVFKDLKEDEKIYIEKAMCNFKPYELSVGYGSGKTWFAAYMDKEHKEGK